MVDAGAGPGTLARAVLAARPAVLEAGALRYVAVERSSAQRAAMSVSRSNRCRICRQGPFVGVVLANELLDNLPFRLAVFDGGWREAFVDLAAGGRFVEVLRPFAAVPRPAGRGAQHGARAPVQQQAAAWVADALGRLEAGRFVVLDYTRTTTADGRATLAGVAPDLSSP